MPKIICLGHGGLDGGAVNGTRKESDDNLRLTQSVRDKLTKQGHTVILTHNGLADKKKLEIGSRRAHRFRTCA